MPVFPNYNIRLLKAMISTKGGYSLVFVGSFRIMKELLGVPDDTGEIMRSS